MKGAIFVAILLGLNVSMFNSSKRSADSHSVRRSGTTYLTQVQTLRYKRIMTPDTPDTPEMSADTPNTPDTPDTDVNSPGSTIAKDNIQISGDNSGDMDDSGYNQVETAKLQPIVSINSSGVNTNYSKGAVKVSWKPEKNDKARVSVNMFDHHVELPGKRKAEKNETLQVSANKFHSHAVKPHKKQNVPMSNSIGGKVSILNKHKGYVSISKGHKWKVLANESMLDRISGLDGRSKVAKHGESNGKTRSTHKKSNVRVMTTGKSHVQVMSQRNATKKQDLGIPSNSDTEGLGGEPVGHLDASQGMEGLGSDMNGIPIGMGAGAEPLGLSKIKDMPSNMEDSGGPIQGLDEEAENMRGSDDLSKPFTEGGGNDQQLGDFVGEGRGNEIMNSLPETHGNEDLHLPSDLKSSSPLIPAALSEQERYDDEHGQMLAPPGSEMNGLGNIAALDKVNIQGDGEVADMVRNAMKQSNVKLKFDEEAAQMNSPITNKKHFFSSSLRTNSGLQNSESSDEGLVKLMDKSSKRRLEKTKLRRHRFKKFKALQK